MAKTIQKPIFTEDLSKYGRFLEASDVNIQASIETMQKEIETHRKICRIIRKYQLEKRVEKEDVFELVRSGCPDFVTLNAFEKLNGSQFNSLDELFDTPAEDIILDCSQTKCETCWKNYLNQMGRLLNQSFVDIKLYESNKEDNDGDPDPED